MSLLNRFKILPKQCQQHEITGSKVKYVPTGVVSYHLIVANTTLFNSRAGNADKRRDDMKNLGLTE